MAENRKQLDRQLSVHLYMLRLSKDLSQAQLASTLGVSQSLIGSYEKGIRLPSVGMLEKYSEAFDASMDVLHRFRIITIKKTVEMYGEEAPLHMQDEYKTILYFESKMAGECND